MKILFLEDDPIIKDIIIEFLQKQGYGVDYAFDIEEAIDFLDTNKYELFLFDVNVPGGDGFSFLSELRNSGDTTPTIFITAKNQIKDLQEGFESGCDDYIKKPFALEELELRINNIKRLYNLDSIIQISKDISIDSKLKHLLIDGKIEYIREKELAILIYFARNSDKIVSHETLVQNIWKYDEYPTDATLRTYIKNIRNLIGNEKIITIKGVGYRFIK